MQIPLFPLNAVLFPGGVLPLRIFEVRYIDMVGDCMKREAPFGICLIASGREVGTAAKPENVGCLAHIAAWDMTQLGVLHIRALGSQRFRILRTHTQPDQLLVGEVELIDADDDPPLAPEHAACSALLQRVIDDLRQQQAERIRAGAEPDDTAIALPFQTPYQMHSSAWVGNRLCEVLRLPLRAKQKLMELEDAVSRLDILTEYLKQHSVI
ncbi:MAG TPA: LON peptidase substrate-binding domain-containing protein [Burkholderiaceae bacterium]|nr:LON peptidase substrate-binding domain-containing protein [Burkholderiaceae bacterium]